MDIFECALSDQFNNNAASVLWLHNNYGEPEEMPVDVFFREEDEMPEMELFAMGQSKGKILDAGAGVGSHSLVLQQAGYDVTALEISATACSIARQRGVGQVVNRDIFNYIDQKYDTILMLMNGIGLAGSLEKLPLFLEHCKQLLNSGGQILFDSSDISYLYDDIPLPQNKYFGEISYRYEYKGICGDWFDWLYADKDTVRKVARHHNLKFEVLHEDALDQYLARLTKRK